MMKRKVAGSPPPVETRSHRAVGHARGAAADGASQINVGLTSTARTNSDAAARASVGDASVEGSRAAGAAGAGWAFVFFVALLDERLRVFIEFETSFKGFLPPAEDRVLGAIGDFRDQTFLHQ